MFFRLTLEASVSYPGFLVTFYESKRVFSSNKPGYFEKLENCYRIQILVI